jgi:hypothetical protein
MNMEATSFGSIAMRQGIAVNAMKSKTSVASFQQTSQPRAAQTHAQKYMF